MTEPPRWGRNTGEDSPTLDIIDATRGLGCARVVFGAIFSVANRLQRTLDVLLPELTAKQFWLLVVISLFDNPPTLSQLAQASDSSHQNVRQLLSKLTAKGFVRLDADPRDSRAVRISRTAKADQWGLDTEAQARDFMASIFSGLDSAELDDLARHLLNIHATLGRIGRAHESSPKGHS
ncbi:MAG: MarR family transcriptional regulator [Propionibacteriaceae bacterium]|nr:MarR family transcriptional regulator [Propionibacteriaceae bacterium]